MENEIEPQVPAVEPTLTPEEIADLRHKAEVSSQNFERAKKAEADKKAAEEQLALLQTPPQEFSDEGKALQERIDRLERERALEKETALMDQLVNQHPALKDKGAEFEQYRLDNPGMRLDTAATAFLVEHDLLTPPTRKGLERQSGGGRTPPKEGMSVEDITQLRNSDYRKYSRLVREGKIVVE